MNGWNHELPKGSEIRCSGKSEHFLPHNMWQPSRFTENNWKPIIVAVREQNFQHL